MSDHDRAPADAPSPDAASEHPQDHLRDTMAQVNEILAREAVAPPLARCAHALQLVRANHGATIPVHEAYLGAFVRDLLRMPLEELAQLRTATAAWTLPGDPTT